MTLPAPQLTSCMSLPAPQLTAASRLHVAAPPQFTISTQLHVAARPACSSQPHLGNASLPAPQLSATPQLHVAARPAAHSRILATPCCPPRSSPECYGRSCVHAVSFPFSFMFAFLCSGDRRVMAFSAASPAVCHFFVPSPQPFCDIELAL